MSSVLSSYVLVDTSVWISLFRKRSSPLGLTVQALVDQNKAMLCGQIWLEYIGGFKKIADRDRARKFFSMLPYLETELKDFDFAADLKAHYPQLGFGDTLIATVAIKNSLSLLTLDKDFKVLEAEGLQIIK